MARKVRLTENELVELIENIVKRTKRKQKQIAEAKKRKRILESRKQEVAKRKKVRKVRK